jgi:hypothetical protein
MMSWEDSSKKKEDEDEAYGWGPHRSGKRELLAPSRSQVIVGGAVARGSRGELCI